MLAYRDSGSLFLTLVLEQPHQEWKLSRLIFNELLFLGVEQSEVLRVSSPQIPDRYVFPILKTIGIPDMFQGVSLGDLNFLAALGLAYRAAIEYLAKAGGDANLAR